MSLLFSTLYRSLDEWLQFLGIVGGGEDGAVAIDKHDFVRATLVGMFLPYTVAVLRMTGAQSLDIFFRGAAYRPPASVTQRNRPCCVILLRPIQEQTAGAE